MTVNQYNELTYGHVTIGFYLPEGVRTPFGVAYWKLKDRKFAFITHCKIAYKIGSQSIVVDSGYIFDGASIPRFLWWIPGFSPLGKHIWAACCHDWMCDRPKEVERVLADSIFYTILKYTGVGRIRSALMYAGVFSYAIWKEMRRKPKRVSRNKT